MLNNFTIKSSGDTLEGTTLKINNVSVSSGASLLAIDAALRVAIVVGDTVYIYAPDEVCLNNAFSRGDASEELVQKRLDRERDEFNYYIPMIACDVPIILNTGTLDDFHSHINHFLEYYLNDML